MNGQSFLFLLPYLASAAITSAIGFYAWRHRVVVGAIPFAVAALAGASATLGYIFELVSPAIETKIFWDNTQWVGVAIWPLAFFVFTLQYTGYRLIELKRLISLLAAPVVIFWLLVLTNDFHGLTQANAWLVPGEPFPALMYDFTPLVWVMVFYSYALILTGLFILGARLFHSHPLYRTQAGLVMFGALILLVDVALIMFGVNLTFQRDTTPFALALSYLVMGWGLFRYRLLDIAPIARHALIESMEDSVIVLDIQNRVIDLNPAACKLIGQSAASLIGQPAEQVFADQADLVNQYQYVNEAHTTLEFGEREEKRYLDLNISPLRNGRGQLTGRLVVIRDVTSRMDLEEELRQHRQHLEELVKQRTAELTEVNEQLKKEITERNQAEEMLRASEYRLSQFLEIIPLGITVYNPDSKLAFINEQAKRIFNLPEALDLTAVPPWQETHAQFPIYLAHTDQLYPPEQFPLIRALQGQTALADDLEYRQADQSIFLEVYARPILDVHGQVAYAISAFQDITARKQTETALRQSEALYRGVIEDQTELVNRHLPDGTLTFVNEAYARDYGQTREELLGSNLYEHIPPDEHAELAQYFASFRPENPVAVSEHRTIIQGDQIRWEQWVDRAFFDEAGRVVEFQSVGRDITSRKQLEERLNAIYHLGQELTLLRDEDAIVRRVLTVALSSLSGEASGYAVVDEAANELVYSFSLVGNDTAQTQMRLPLTGQQGLAVAVVRSGQFLTVADTLQEPRYVAGPNEWTGRSAMYAPLKINGQVGGVLIVEDHEPNHFTRADELLFETLAGQAAVAIENARLFKQVAHYSEELEQRVDARTAELAQETANMAVLQQVTQEIAANLELEKVYLAAHEAAKRLMPVDAFIIALLDEKQQEIEDAYLFDQGQRWPNERQPLGRGLTSTIIITGQSLRLDSCCDEASNQAIGAELFGSEEDTCSVLATPLRLTGKIIGMLSAQAYPPYAYTDNQLRLLETLASQVAISVANARLYQQAQQEIAERQRAEKELEHQRANLQQAHDELAVLNGIASMVATITDLPVALETVAEIITGLFAARATGIALLNPARTELTIVAEYIHADPTPKAVGVKIPLENNPSAVQLLETAETVIIPQPQHNPLVLAMQPLMQVRRTECLLIAPLLVRGEIIGTIGVDTTDPQRQFTSAEATLLETISSQIAGAIENARLYDQERQQRQLAESLQETALILNSSLEMEQVLLQIMGQLRHVIPYDSGALFLQAGEDLCLEYGIGLEVVKRGYCMPISSQRPVAKAFRNKQPLVIADVLTDPDWLVLAESEQIRSWMGAPLIIGDQALGLLTADSFQVNIYSQEDTQILQSFANQAAIAIQNARLFQQAQQEISERQQVEEALRRSETLLRQMGDNLPNGAIYQVAQRPDGFVYFPYMSAGVERIFGVTVQEVQTSATDFRSLILPEDLPLLRADEAESAQNLTIFDCEFRQYTRQGEIKWIHCRAAPRRLTDGSTLWDGVWLDITARKKAEETLRRRNDYLGALHYVAVDLLNRREVAEVLQTIVERAAELLDAPYGEISLIEADELVVRAFTKNQPFLAGDRLRRGEGVLTWQVFDSHKPIILENYTEWANSRALYSSLSLRATADFPILAGNKCLGVLALGRDIPGYSFDEEQVQVGMWFAQLAALALDNAQWYAAAQWELVERRRAEAALRASEAQLKKARTQLVDAIESLTEGFALYDTEDRLVMCNSIFQQYYDLSADLLQPGVHFEEHIRHSIYRGQVKIAPGSEEAWIEERVKQHRQPEGSFLQQLGNGRWLQVSERRTREGGIVGVRTDITERKRAEEALQQAHDELAGRVGELALLNYFSQLLATINDMPTAMASVTEAIGRQFQASCTSLALLNSTRIELTVAAEYLHHGSNANERNKTISLADNPFVGQVIETAQTIVITQPDSQPWNEDIAGLMQARRTECLMIAPLLAWGETIGLLWVGTDESERKFTSAEVTLLETIAAQIAGALENARLFQQEQEQRQLAESLREVSIALNYSLDWETVIAKIWEQLQLVIPYDSAGLFLHEDDSLVLVGGVHIEPDFLGHQMPITSQNPTLIPFRLKKPVAIDDVSQHPYWQEDCPPPDSSTYLIKNWMGAPLLSTGEAMGVLTTDKFEADAYHQAQANILQIFANQAAIAIQNARLYRQAQQDLKERRRAEEQMRHMALHDALTGLPNRTLFMTRLDQALHQARDGEGQRLAVLFIDLDRFKTINDSLGHQAGDHLLVTVAQRLRRCVRSSDTVARLSGDEFTILLDPLHDIREAEQVAERIQRELALPVKLQNQNIFTSASIGIVSDAQTYERAEELLRDVDLAMYQAKTEGRARHALFEPTQRSYVLERWELESDLRQALARQEMSVYYQPVVALTSGQMSEVEALLRWQHPQRGLLDASQFISVAEETGLITPLSEWLFRTACTQVQAWRAEGHKELRLGVNLSAHQLQRPDLPALLQSILAETGLEPAALELEISETIAAYSVDLAILTELKELGVSLAIDDFGIGPSLAMLKEFPFSTLKIDRSLLSGLTGNAGDRAIVLAAMALGHHLNLKVIAEGVETEDQLALLWLHHCDEIQGYLFSPPVSAEALSQLLQTDGLVLQPAAGLTEALERSIQAKAMQRIGYALVDENLIILTSNTSFNRWAEGQPGNLIGCSLSQVLPEIIGVEEELRQLSQLMTGEFTLPEIYRPGHLPDWGYYLDVRIEPLGVAGAALLVTLTDVTEQALVEFELRQERNELRLKLMH